MWALFCPGRSQHQNWFRMIWADRVVATFVEGVGMGVQMAT